MDINSVKVIKWLSFALGIITSVLIAAFNLWGDPEKDIILFRLVGYKFSFSPITIPLIWLGGVTFVVVCLCELIQHIYKKNGGN